MKTRTLWLLVGLALAISTAVLLTNNSAVAEPPDAGNIYLFPMVTTPKSPPNVQLVTFASGFTKNTITGIVHAGDERLFIVDKVGRIYILQPDGTALEKPFLDIKQNVATSFEEGLLGLVFHPDFPATPYFYVVYTDSKHVITLSRFNVSHDNPDAADKNSEVKLLSIKKLHSTSNDAYKVHNAGDLHFGPDGYLYIAIGDGGPDPWWRGGDPHNAAQRLDEMLGNILRIDVNAGAGHAPDCGSKEYTIPAGNPFVDGEGGSCDEVWSYGLRNPYRFSFDSKTGEMYLGDVGEGLREEINFQRAGSAGGENYGWHCYEGSIDYSVVDPEITANCSPDMQYAMPIFEYPHDNGECSVIGGYVYRGSKYPDLYGRYVFADFCSGPIWLLTRTGPAHWSATIAAEKPQPAITSFGQDVHGEIYAGETGGKIYKLVALP